MKIAVASLIQETCSFNPATTTLRDFKECYFKLGSEVVNIPANELIAGGFVAAMKPRNFQLVGILSAHAGAGPPLSAPTFAALQALLLSGLAQAGPFDAVFLSLMGAMAAENEPDTEGAMLAAVRKLVGPHCLIAVALDHHANVTEKMVEAADVVVGYETQPHDFPGSGAKTARVLLDLWDNKRTPRGALVKIPMLTPQDHFLTAAGPMKAWFDLAREIEKDPAVIAASTVPSQPWLDVPETGWSSLVYADTAATARAYAEKLAQKAWDLRDQFWRSERLSVPATIAAANAEAKGLVVISDTGDSTYGGASGDSTALLAEMLKAGVSGPALVPLVDPAALEQAIAAGIGRELTLPIGGKISPGFSPPVAVTGVVKAVAPGGYLDFGDGRAATAGRSVLLELGEVKIVLLERADVAINHPVLYEKLGLDVGQAKMVVLKTAGNFQYFTKYQSRLIRADSPGMTQSDLTAFRWKQISHPLYPFDEIKSWTPQAAAQKAQAAKIHRDSIVVDGHVHITERVVHEGIDPWQAQATGLFDYARAKQGGLKVAIHALYLENPYHRYNYTIKHACRMIETLRRGIEAHPDKMELALSGSDIRRIVAEGKMAQVIGLEGGFDMEGDLDVLRFFYRAGVRTIQFVHHRTTSSFADSYGDLVQVWDGMNERGRAIVHEMNRLGILIDLAHASEATQYQVLAASRAPVVASHVGAKHFSDHAQNLSDDLLQRVAAGGGLIGVHGHGAFLAQKYWDRRRLLQVGDWRGPAMRMTREAYDRTNTYIAELDARQHEDWKHGEHRYGQPWRETYFDDALIPGIDDFVATVDYLVNLIGADHVGIGLDLMWGGYWLRDFDATCYPRLTEAFVAQGYDEATIRKLLGENWLRVLDAAKVQQLTSAPS